MATNNPLTDLATPMVNLSGRLPKTALAFTEKDLDMEGEARQLEEEVVAPFCGWVENFDEMTFSKADPPRGVINYAPDRQTGR